MNDTRRLTNPTLRICGRIEGSDTYGEDGAANSTQTGPAALGWLNGLFGFLRCNGRRKEWRTDQRTTSCQLAVSNDFVVRFIKRVSEISQSQSAPMTDSHLANDNSLNYDGDRIKHYQEPILKSSDYFREPKNPQHINFNWFTSDAVSDIFKVLLVFPRADQQSEILAGVAQKLGWTVSEARNAEEATALFGTCCHDLAIVDRRGSLVRCQEADQICRSLMEANASKRCSIVALVKKSYFTAPHKEELVILHLLNIGYNRALMECSHEGILMNELIGIYASESQPKSQLAGAQLLYLAVDRCRDIVHVTNDQYIIQFANKASEWLLGYKQDELRGKNLQEFVTNEHFAPMNQQLQKGKEFEGHFEWKKKLKGLMSVNCRIIPMNVPWSKTRFYVYLYDSSTSLEWFSSSVSFQHYPQRPSLQSMAVRRSLQMHAAPDKPKRSTITKLHNLPLEAPITKIITLLTQAVGDTETPNVKSQIQSAIEMLKHTELYSAYFKEDPLTEADPFKADFVGALISIPNDNRKSSGASFGRQSALLHMSNGNPAQPLDVKILNVPGSTPELQELLERGFDWDFDIFKLETITDHRPLTYLGMTVMNHFRVAERLQCDEQTLQNWLTIIEANYNRNVSYHNSTHATDVLQACARFMRSERLQQILDPMDEVAALLSAAAHDIDHPGKSSQFLSNTNNKLAILYNDLTVLESHHSALTFQVTLVDDKVNIFKNLEKDEYKSLRQNIIDMILATEMTKHFEHLARFVNLCSHKHSDTEDEIFNEEIVDLSVLLLPENVTLTKRMMIKCADVSNPTRPFRLYVEWTRRIAEEYFDQTDEEKKKKLPVVMPMFDRACCCIPKSQIGFVEYIINDMMEAWDAFIDMPEIIGYMNENYIKWKELNEQGVNTLEDIVKLQETTELKLYTKAQF